MELTKRPFYILGVIAIIVTFFTALKVTSMQAALFSSTPYMFILILLGIARQHTAILSVKIISVLIVFVGLYILLDSIFIRRDMDSAFSFLLIPVWQWIMLLLSGFVIFMSNRYER